MWNDPDCFILHTEPHMVIASLLGASLTALGGTCRAGGIKQAPVQPDPWAEEWPNTVAICAMAGHAHVDDLVEWLQYHKYASNC